MEENKQQTARIRRMERCLDNASTAIRRLSAALDKFVSVQEAIAKLDEYYGSEEWRQDLADDEAGHLPKDLKRGVLSEDGIWNLLTDNKEIKQRLKAVAETTSRGYNDRNNR